MLNVIQANCRVQFTAEDLDFILGVLRPHGQSPKDLLDLLTDEASRDLILDDPTLFRAVLEQPQCLRISTHFYFYILVRHVFLSAGLKDRELADYVAEVLAQFSQMENTRCVIKGRRQSLEYFVDMLSALQGVDATTAFYLRTHIGNQSLWLVGVFPDRLRYRSERRGAPDVGFYEEIGRSSYRAARDHQLARKYELAGIFDLLSECFPATRRALNDLGERLLSLGDNTSEYDSLLGTSPRKAL